VKATIGFLVSTTRLLDGSLYHRLVRRLRGSDQLRRYLQSRIHGEKQALDVRNEEASLAYGASPQLAATRGGEVLIRLSSSFDVRRSGSWDVLWGDEREGPDRVPARGPGPRVHR
jgi:hypothetical protein